MATCRLCKETGDEGQMVRYAVRHMAHFHCYLKAGKTLSALRPWAVRRFPAMLLKQHGLLAEAERLGAE